MSFQAICSSACALAALLSTLTSFAAESESLVSGLSAQATLQNEASPAVAAESQSKVSAPLPKLELSAGSDHLLDSPSFLKQSSVFAEARFSANRWLQLGASGAIRVQGDGNGSADLAAQLLLGPTFNFGTESGLQNSFFLSPKIGPTLAHTTALGAGAATETRLAAELTVGKRFSLGKNLAFAPAIGEIWQSGFSPSIVVQPLALSLFI